MQKKRDIETILPKVFVLKSSIVFVIDLGLFVGFEPAVPHVKGPVDFFCEAT